MLLSDLLALLLFYFLFYSWCLFRYHDAHPSHLNHTTSILALASPGCALLLLVLHISPGLQFPFPLLLMILERCEVLCIQRRFNRVTMMTG